MAAWSLHACDAHTRMHEHARSRTTHHKHLPAVVTLEQLPEVDVHKIIPPELGAFDEEVFLRGFLKHFF